MKSLTSELKQITEQVAAQEKEFGSREYVVGEYNRRVEEYNRAKVEVQNSQKSLKVSIHFLLKSELFNWLFLNKYFKIRKCLRWANNAKTSSANFATVLCRAPITSSNTCWEPGILRHAILLNFFECCWLFINFVIYRVPSNSVPNTRLWTWLLLLLAGRNRLSRRRSAPVALLEVEPTFARWVVENDHSPPFASFLPCGMPSRAHSEFLTNSMSTWYTILHKNRV